MLTLKNKKHARIILQEDGRTHWLRHCCDCAQFVGWWLTLLLLTLGRQNRKTNALLTYSLLAKFQTVGQCLFGSQSTHF